MSALCRKGKENLDKIIRVKKLVEGKYTTEYIVSDYIKLLGELERNGDVRSSLATVEKLKECAQKFDRKMQEIRENYGKCRGIHWLVRVYSDGGELKKLEREFRDLVDGTKGVLDSWKLL